MPWPAAAPTRGCNPLLQSASHQQTQAHIRKDGLPQTVAPTSLVSLSSGTRTTIWHGKFGSRAQLQLILHTPRSPRTANTGRTMTFRRGTTRRLTAGGTLPRAPLLLGGLSRAMQLQLPRRPRTKSAYCHSLKQSTLSYHGAHCQGWSPQVHSTMEMLQSIHQMPLPLHPRALVPQQDRVGKRCRSGIAMASATRSAFYQPAATELYSACYRAAKNSRHARVFGQGYRAASLLHSALWPLLSTTLEGSATEHTARRLQL